MAILLVLSLIVRISQECLAAAPAAPATRSESDSVEVVQDERDPGLLRSDREFLPFAGKRVGRIRIETLSVFGPSIEDTSRPAATGMESFLNHLNFQTREATIRRTLLFREGDVIDPFRLAESERLLRNLSFLRDARINVVQNGESGDSADLLVTVKELWSLTLSGRLNEGNRLNVSLTERNLFGLGHQVSGAVTLIPDASSGIDASYSVQNIGGSFITGELAYANMPGQRVAGLSFSRDLVSPVLQYAGGLDLRQTVITVEDSLPSAADNTSNLIDLWTGRQLHLGHRQMGVDYRRILFISGRIRRLTFTRRPPVTPTTLYQYHDIDYVLGSIGLIQSRYYRTSLLYDFGRTEDVPYGFLARATYGLADAEFARSTYAAATMAAGERIAGLGYGAGELRIGGYPEFGKLEQGVIRLRTLYFSNLLHAGAFRFRQFFNAEYTAGIHRSADDSIDFSGDESIRGVTYNGSVTGSKRLQLNLETVVFTPLRTRGVTFAFFSFADLDIIGSGNESIFRQDCYSGLGLGVRLHKAAYGIVPVQLRFAWYPRLPVAHRKYSFTVFGEKRFRSIDFLGSRPEIVEY